MPHHHLWLCRLASASALLSHSLLVGLAWARPSSGPQPADAPGNAPVHGPQATQRGHAFGASLTEPASSGQSASSSRPNRPPILQLSSYSVALQQRAWLKFYARDPDGDRLSYSMNPVPAGASFDPSSGVLSWQPTPEQLGTHQSSITVSDGHASVSQTVEISVTSAWEDAWGALLQPAVGASVYMPRTRRHGSFYGGGVSITLASWIHRTNDPGPAHGQLYLAALLLESDQAEASPLFSYHAGVSLSFEANPVRRWLIPLYGAEFGGFVHRQLKRPFATTAFAGAYLYAGPGISLATRAGYTVVPTGFRELSGLNASLRLDLALW